MTTPADESVETEDSSDFSATPAIDEKIRVEQEDMEKLFEELHSALTEDEDEDQKSLVTILQKNRKYILRYAMQQYIANPKSASLLEGVTSLIGHMEKTIRDDRKERMKKQENQDNAISFKQMLDAMSMISSGTLNLPKFDLVTFMPDPNQSLLAGLDVKPINEHELVQGNQLVNIDGEPI